MPHDLNGQPLAVGDKVNVPCVVTDVQPNQEYCNLTLATEHPMHPGDHKSSLTLNTKQVVKVVAAILLLLTFAGLARANGYGQAVVRSRVVVPYVAQVVVQPAYVQAVYAQAVVQQVVQPVCYQQQIVQQVIAQPVYAQAVRVQAVAYPVFQQVRVQQVVAYPARASVSLNIGRGHGGGLLGSLLNRQVQRSRAVVRGGY